jgi:TPR repeat protein
LGRMFRDGRGVAQDDAGERFLEAVRLASPAAAQGHPNTSEVTSDAMSTLDIHG